MKWRYFLVLLCFSAIYGWLSLNLYDLQIEKGQGYSLKAAAQGRMLNNLLPKRGVIYLTDRSPNAIPAAVNRDYGVIFAVPKEIEDPEEASAMLGSVLAGWDRAKLRDALSKKEDEYELLLEKADEASIQAVKSLGLKGIHTGEDSFRYYPFRRLASQTLGFVGVNEKTIIPSGLYGAEKMFDGVLQSGKDILLTIDRNIQAEAETILERLIEDASAKGGSVIVEDPQTGRIIALAGKPDFDPNSYSAFDLSAFLNPVVQSVYEPGSVFKVLTMAAGIDGGKLSPDTVYFDAGKVTLNGKTIENWDKKAYGRTTMTEVLEHSVNTGAVYAEGLIGNSLFYEYLIRFGLGDKTGVSLPGEVNGSLGSIARRDARQIDFASASFGQGVAVSPLALINAFSAIANGGILKKALILADEKPEDIRRVIAPETASQVKKMMASAVEKAQVAKIDNYEIAGKTGTAQVPNFKTGGYTDEVINTYIGFPVNNPRFAILVKLDKPRGAPLAGATVVPAFRELAQFILNYYNVPPDNL